MTYYSLNKQTGPVDFKEATILGQAPDKGLYFPSVIPQHPYQSIESLKGISAEEIGFQVMKPYVDPAIPDEELRKIIRETLSFNIPLVRINENTFSLELYHGPTLAFKDVGARFMSRCLGYFSREKKEKIIVLVATSGDTGGAVADGFYGVDGVDVVILYPSGKVSPVQELQLTTFGGNIHALEVQGDFDACQKIVKQAFADTHLKEQLFLTSANSINVARWLPQQMYYFLALQQWQEKEPPVICVPSGNFGNICAGMLAWKAGLPVKHFIAACNANDVVTEYLLTGDYRSATAIATLSNAMDVGDPSNFVRILNIFQQSHPELAKMMSSYSISDLETEHTIQKVYQDHQYLLDPHGAVGYAAFEKYLGQYPGSKGIVLETAHPVKFPASVEKILGRSLDYPPQVEKIRHKEKKSTLIQANYQQVKDFLLSTYLHG
jgi:threonine synthase